ncbi:MAG TPA: histidine phosphatase family protein, partial [Acetobacteraceae bacterium]|nr:histidine phosphatase family protein [Acetobacteraceae bacterium]
MLLRHAKSSWDDPKLSDRDRPLNKRGRRAAATMRQAMQDLGLSPDLILVSTARRTQETLAALEPWDETPLIEPLESLYLASAPQLLDVLRGTNETVRSVMLIGHNPGMHELAVSLAGSRESEQIHRL